MSLINSTNVRIDNPIPGEPAPMSGGDATLDVCLKVQLVVLVHMMVDPRSTLANEAE